MNGAGMMLVAISLGLLGGCCCAEGGKVEATAAATFDAAYREANRGKIAVEIPEVYELVNIAIALTPRGLESDTLVYKSTPYYADVLRHFEAAKDHPFVAALQVALGAAPLAYFDLKTNAYSFEYGAEDRIERSRIYRRTTFEEYRKNSLLPMLDLMRSFSEDSRFREFYAAHRQLYESQIAYVRNDIGVERMMAWLQKRYPAVKPYDSIKIVFSPLVGRNQSVFWIENNGFRELQPHVNFPYPDESDAQFSPEAAALRRGRILFTELNHGFNDPTAQPYADSVADAVDVEYWNRKLRAAYDTPILVFNEMLNWGLLNLYYYDHAPPAERDRLIAEVDRQMAGYRGFVHFPQFSSFLVRLYRERPEGTSVAALYPAIVEWFAENGPSRAPERRDRIVSRPGLAR